MKNEINGYIRKVAIREKHERFIEQHIPKYDELNVYNSFQSIHEVKINFLKKYIPRLNSDDQMLLKYRFYDEYSYKKISEIMGLSENSLRTRMTRLLKKIQSYIESKGA
jgi:RNA polymerase sigma factor (sigma-70 family)